MSNFLNQTSAFQIATDLVKAVLASSDISKQGFHSESGQENADYVNALFDGIYNHLSEIEHKA